MLKQPAHFEGLRYAEEIPFSTPEALLRLFLSPWDGSSRKIRLPFAWTPPPHTQCILQEQGKFYTENLRKQANILLEYSHVSIQAAWERSQPVDENLNFNTILHVGLFHRNQGKWSKKKNSVSRPRWCCTRTGCCAKKTKGESQALEGTAGVEFMPSIGCQVYSTTTGAMFLFHQRRSARKRSSGKHL